jgi:[acyl-carrier-protein] S-malonyltransferase
MSLLTNKNFAALFPGQGAQTTGMGKELSEKYQEVKDIYQQADDILGYSISNISWENPKESLNETNNTQPALLVHSYAAWAVFQKEFPTNIPSFTAGHSLGQFSALVASDSISFESGLRLVQTRGQLMKEAGISTPGGMAALLGLDIKTVESICEQASDDQNKVTIANDNCPGQIVISGSQISVEKCLVLAIENGARKAIPLAVSVAAHSYLMGHAQAEFNVAVDEINYQTPNIPIIGNVSAKPLSTIEEIRTDLKAQLTNRVRWTESMQYLLANDVESTLELGTGAVLSGLMKRIDRKLPRFNIGSPADIEKLRITP